MNKVQIEREFAASIDAVFAAWSKAEILLKWWAPEGMEVTKFEGNFSVGENVHYTFAVDGFDVYGMLTYQEIDAPNKIVLIDNFTDKNGDIVAPAHYEMAGDTPNPMRVEAVFREHGDKTRLIINITTEDGSAIDPSIEEGWQGMLAKLGAELA